MRWQKLRGKFVIKTFRCFYDTVLYGPPTYYIYLYIIILELDYLMKHVISTSILHMSIVTVKQQSSTKYKCLTAEMQELSFKCNEYFLFKRGGLYDEFLVPLL